MGAADQNPAAPCSLLHQVLHGRIDGNPCRLDHTDDVRSRIAISVISAQRESAHIVVSIRTQEDSNSRTDHYRLPDVVDFDIELTGLELRK